MDIAVLMFNVGAKGGAERISIDWINEMSKRGYQITLYSIYGKNKTHYPLSPKVGVESCGCIENPGWTEYLKSAIRLRTRLKKGKYKTIVIVGTPLVLFSWIATLFLSIKRILWDHSAFRHNKPHWRLLCCWLVNYLVVLTSTDNKMYRKKYPIRIAKIVTIYNFVTDVENTVTLRADLTSKRVISVGRLSYEKGVDRLIDVWAKIEPQCDSWELDIVGEGVMREELKAKIRDLNLRQVRLLGHKSNIDELMAKSSILAMTSRTEGLPMVLLEAQSVALPCIAYDCPSGPREIITKDNGILVQDGNANEFTQALLYLINSPDKRLYFSDNCAQNLKRFSRDKILSQWGMII